MLTRAGLGRGDPSNPLSETARVATLDGVELASVGFGELERQVPGRSTGHVTGPDIHGQGLSVRLLQAVDADEGAPTFRITDPHGGAKKGCVANVPGISVVVRGPRLAC